MAFKNLIQLGALVIVLSVPNVGLSQIDVPGPRFRFREVESPDSTKPAATPGSFNYDYQVFAPVEFPNGQELAPNTGFFFTFDRIYTSISGSTDISSGGNEFIWGNRYELGYFTEANDGWTVTYEQSEGNQFINGGNIAVPNPTQLTTRFASVEVNKVFRQPLKNGGLLEPYLGLRYFNLSDSTIEDTSGILLGGLVNANRFTQNVTNDAVGFNVGGRLVQRRGRWRFSNDLSLSTNFNQQDFRSQDISEFFGVPPFIPPSIVSAETDDSNSAFVPALDYRFEMAYNLSRDFGFRGGASFTYLWDGIARANGAATVNNPNSAFGLAPLGGEAGLVDDRLITAGVSFGFEYRR